MSPIDVESTFNLSSSKESKKKHQKKSLGDIEMTEDNTQKGENSISTNKKEDKKTKFNGES